MASKSKKIILKEILSVLTGDNKRYSKCNTNPVKLGQNFISWRPVWSRAHE